MIFIHLAALSGVFIMGACYLASWKKRPSPPAVSFAVLFAAAFLLRIAAAALSEGFGADTACFAAWAERLCETGPSAFYSPNVFSDYPPGYLYVLWLLGSVRRLFGIEPYSAAHLVLLRLPSILADLACGMLLGREAVKRLSGRRAFFLSAAYLFNPAVFLNSSVWGQVDALPGLAAVVLCLSLIRGKLYPAYIAFGLGFLVKPQMLLLGPVLLAGTIDYILRSPDRRGGTKRAALPAFGHCLFQCLTVAAGAVILCLPFGLSNVVSQLADTVGSYPYAGVNVCNLWGLLGLNWVSQDSTFLGISYRAIGMAAIAAAALLTLFLSRKNRGSRAEYPFLAAFTVVSVFLFSVRMHERYLYPALALLLLAYICKPVPLTFLCYTCFSAMHFYNTADVLFFYDPASYDRRSPAILLVSAGMLSCGALLYFIAWRHYGGRPAANQTEPDVPLSRQGRPWEDKILVRPWQDKILAAPLPSRKRPSIGTADVLCMLAVTAAYSCFALYDLGDAKAPVTPYEMVQNQSIELTFASVLPSRLSYYIAPWHDRTFILEEMEGEPGEKGKSPEEMKGGTEESERNWSYVGEISLDKVFSWQDAALDASSPRIRLTLTDAQACLLELVFTDEEGNMLLPENAADYPALFDEAGLYPEEPSFRNGMYFDEIYHGRTAYEFLHGLTSYENTHPPLGKLFIALGVAVFGMNPFGWRIAGTLFGIVMVPVIYLFAKRISGNTFFSALACVLFAFDFMHFTQTRIATIDVYITFFVLLMYYFMYQYVTLSFYDTPLKKTWIPLGACGVCMGLGIACKWTGIYAGIGLGLIFSASLCRRYLEYLYAKKDPQGQTAGISHAHIIAGFSGNVRRTILFCLVFFAAVPAVIYLLSYLPFRDYADRGLIARMLHNQNTMFSYHSQLESTHPYSSPWYDWPIVRRPIWYYSRIVTQTAQGGLREGISAFGSPAVWWAGIPAFLYTLYLAAAKKDRTAGFLTVGYLAQYLPWMFVTRTTFIYHYFPSVAFVVLMLLYSVSQGMKKAPRGSFRAAAILYAAALYTLAAFALFLLFYPVLSGQPVEASFVAKYLRWFPTWVLTAR